MLSLARGAAAEAEESDALALAGVNGSIVGERCRASATSGLNSGAVWINLRRGRLSGSIFISTSGAEFCVEF